MIYFMIGFLFSILAAGAVDGDASLTTLSILTVAGIGFMCLGTYMMNKKDDQDLLSNQNCKGTSWITRPFPTIQKNR